MASRCSRIISRASISSLKSAFKKPPASSAFGTTRLPNATASPLRSFSRFPTELGAVSSLLPLHSAVATARMTSCLSTTSRCCRALSQGTLCCTSPDL